MSSYFPLKTLWRSYFCALVATAVLAVGSCSVKESLAILTDSQGNEPISDGSTRNVSGSI